MTGAIGLSCSLPTDCVQGPYLASHPTRRTASLLEVILPTDCVLASLRQDARCALRSGKMQGVRFAQARCKESTCRTSTKNYHYLPYKMPSASLLIAMDCRSKRARYQGSAI